MALSADNVTIASGIHGWFSRAQRWASDWFQPADYSPEADLMNAPYVDPALVPQAPMSNREIDVGVLSHLSGAGLKRAKLITEQSHPTLMGIWRAKCQKFGLGKPPQLLMGENSSLNALTMGDKEEIALTTGLLKKMNRRQVSGVLDHELGHEVSDHTTPRVLAMVGFGAIGAVIGSIVGKAGGIGYPIINYLRRFEPVNRTHTFLFGPNPARAAGFLGGAIYVAIGIGIGHLVANRLTVRSTELEADAKGAQIGGDPEGMAQALRILRDNQTKNPGLIERFLRFYSGYPSLETRIERLDKMTLEQRTQGIVPSLAMEAPQSAVPQASVQQVTGAERIAASPEPQLVN